MLGVEPHELRVLGGGAKSRLWSQIKADVCGVPVVVPHHGEAAVLGAAILAAVGCRLHQNIPSAAKSMARDGAVLEPNPRGIEVYERTFSLYVALYESVKDLYARSSSLDPFLLASKET
jgi:sugar (pentulose or hexulose) kinase